ncbi:hypothetical protein V8V54_06635 [Priestia megaterium]|jgi:hypothetical protein|uniref:hypothetical protein n=1 Tax=Priestia megaterium TaxID=1404 RepID=UPI000BF30F46|nr:hypothetical protein [Priestia megaterium]MCM3151027.1 hypothetical protein [Priestia megaterium]PEU72280.1 hypothetical protein CN397_05235 [Priestia megaterium]PFW49518.1 hypothetical protein COL17_16290 [Priestia megaterium]
MDEFRKSTAPFYFADHIWKDKNGMTTYGMLLTNRPEDDGDYDLHSLLEEAYVDHKKILITTVYDNSEQQLNGYVIHLSDDQDVFTFMDDTGAKLVIDFYDVVEIEIED